jgi:hypothetical protein
MAPTPAQKSNLVAHVYVVTALLPDFFLLSFSANIHTQKNAETQPILET